MAISATAQGVRTRTRQFPPGLLKRSTDLPVSRLRDRLERLPAPARDKALSWLSSFHFTELDLQDLEIDSSGGIYYADQFVIPPTSEAIEPPVTSAAPVPVSPFPEDLVFHSRPGAPNVLYLDFDGENVTGTEWNTDLSKATIYATPFSSDGDFTTYSDAEQGAIKRIWQRVAEDYAPFNVDVTTERPTSFGPRTGQALITKNTDSTGAQNPSSSAGGIAYVNVFGTSSYARTRPAWIYHNNLANSEAYIAEATSHELGHNLGLSHDGTTSDSYYGGHGFGETSWGPLMGTGYGRNVSQWSKGEYYLANNSQDDLAIISNKLTYRGDDHSASMAFATPLKVTSETNILVTTPETDPGNTTPSNKGVIEKNTDQDMFKFSTGEGPVNIQVRPYVSAAGTKGGNLDIALELLDQAGTVLLSNNADSATAASVQTNLPQGEYYLRIGNSGTGSPLSASPTGYTSYGSIGQYFISGTISPTVQVSPTSLRLDIAVSPANTGTVAPASGTFSRGTAVQLVATPAQYYTFKQWAGAISTTENPVSLVISSNISMTAIFEEVLTKQYPTPYWWLAVNGYTGDYEKAVVSIGANGYPVWQSYVAGLNPRDPDSRLIVTLERGQNGPILTWPSVLGRTYTILQSNNPLTGFTPLTGAANLPSTTNRIAVNTGGSSDPRYYRVQVSGP